MACYELDTEGPCPKSEFENFVGVNETSLQIICTKGFVERRFGEDSVLTNQSTQTPTITTTESPICFDRSGKPVYYKYEECFRGGHRYLNQRCPEQVKDQHIEQEKLNIFQY